MRLITDPNKFFWELKQGDVKIKKPLLAIVLPLAVVISTYQYLLMNKLSQALPEELSPFFTVGASIGIIGSFIGIFATWLIIAAIMHGLSAFFEGKGSFRRTFEFVGYGFSSLIGSLITVPISAHYIANAEIPEINLVQLQQNSLVKQLLTSIIPKDVIYSSLIINLAVTLWSLTIWTFALRHARELELRNAFVCSLIPTVLFSVYQIWSILKLL